MGIAAVDHTNVGQILQGRARRTASRRENGTILHQCQQIFRGAGKRRHPLGSRNLLLAKGIRSDIDRPSAAVKSHCILTGARQKTLASLNLILQGDNGFRVVGWIHGIPP